MQRRFGMLPSSVCRTMTKTLHLPTNRQQLPLTRAAGQLL
uniref:Uncharacterized protein n=1 Tax=Anguilla anguilla TaxID=7936 RepID=A0A0E9UBC6_ANGAN